MGDSTCEVSPPTCQPIGESRKGSLGLGGGSVDQSLQIRSPRLKIVLNMGINVLLGANSSPEVRATILTHYTLTSKLEMRRNKQ